MPINAKTAVTGLVSVSSTSSITLMLNVRFFGDVERTRDGCQSDIMMSRVGVAVCCAGRRAEALSLYPSVWPLWRSSRVCILELLATLIDHNQPRRGKISRIGVLDQRTGPRVSCPSINCVTGSNSRVRTSTSTSHLSSGLETSGSSLQPCRPLQY